MADRYRGTMYVGVTADLPPRIHQHRTDEGSDFCKRYGLHRLVWAEQAPSIIDAIAHEKRIERWRRERKFTLIERGNPGWQDLFDSLARTREAGLRAKPGVTKQEEEDALSARGGFATVRSQHLILRKLPLRR